MGYSERMIGMLRTLSDAPGAPGFEDAVVEAARGYAATIGHMEEDFLRNLYITRKENRGDRPVIMLDAHSDEVGLIVQHIKPNGCLRFLPLGSWNRGALVSAKVLVRNALGEYIPGIIATKPVHFLSAAEKAGQGEDISEMIIDIGATSAEEAREYVRPGDVCVFDTAFELFGDGLVKAKAIDDRAGCAIMIELMKQAQ